MKRQITVLLLIALVFTVSAVAQDQPGTTIPKSQMSSTFVKDPGFGSRVNFGVTFAPTIEWMYPHTEGYEKNGVIMGMRYGINLNVNLTERKNFYFSTGVFAEHCGGKMKFLDNVPVGSLGIADSTNFFICGNAGLMHSFNLYSTHTDSYQFDEDIWSREKQTSEEAALFKEAFIVGVGFEYSVTPTMRAGVMLNYAQTFSNYFKGKGKAQNSLSKLDQRANLGYVEIALNINFF